MNVLAVSQRVDAVPNRGERRDSIDQRWPRFLKAAGFTPLLMPNNTELLQDVLPSKQVIGVVLTGGNDLAVFGGDAPERDETETLLIEVAKERGWPILGVCRGMQFLQHMTGQKLHPVDGHVAGNQMIEIAGTMQKVNSFHLFGASKVSEPWGCWARSADGVIKAIRHNALPWLGIMWHPERIEPFRPQDLSLFTTHFLGGGKCEL
jgi:gamma-glutamyl-gamma-aminobutyrate hydrolase PuuD